MTNLELGMIAEDLAERFGLRLVPMMRVGSVPDGEDIAVAQEVYDDKARERVGICLRVICEALTEPL